MIALPAPGGRTIIVAMTAPACISALPSEAATAHLGEAIAAVLAPGDCVLLEGGLGAGKSALARAILRGLAADPALDVPSPTFTLVQSYDIAHPAHGRFTASHFDLWRLSGPDGLEELGWDDAREGVVLVEWPERLGALRPDRALGVQLEPGDAAEARLVRLSGAPMPVLPASWPR